MGMNRTEDNPKLLRKKEYEIEETVFAKYKDGAQLYRATVLEKVTSASKRRGDNYTVKYHDDLKTFTVSVDDMGVWPYDKIPVLPENLQNDNKVPVEIEMKKGLQQIVIFPRTSKTNNTSKTPKQPTKGTGEQTKSKTLYEQPKNVLAQPKSLPPKQDVNSTNIASPLTNSKKFNETSLSASNTTSDETLHTPERTASTDKSLHSTPSGSVLATPKSKGKIAITKVNEHCVGDRVWSIWNDNCYYQSTVIQCNSDGTYSILFDDNKKKDLPSTSISSVKPEKPGVYANINAKKRKENERIVNRAIRLMK